MKSRNVIMAGAALMFFGGPAFAGESTPAEKEATRQLNLLAAREAAPGSQQVGVIDASAVAAAAPTMPGRSWCWMRRRSDMTRTRMKSPPRAPFHPPVSCKLSFGFYFASLSAARAAALAVTADSSAPQAMSINDTFSDHVFRVARFVRS